MARQRGMKIPAGNMKRAAWWYYYMGGSGGRGSQPDTSSDGKQVFLVVGDSIAAGGNSGGDQTLPISGTAYEWVSSALAEFGATSMSAPSAVNVRSPWAKFCIDYYTNSGKKPVIVNRGYSSSAISVTDNDNDWTATGDHRAAAITDAGECMTSVGVTKLKGIFIILGINDVQNLNGTGSNNVATISTAYSNLIDALIAEFGSDVPILFCQIGRTASITVSARLTGVRNAIKSKCIAYDNVHFAGSLSSFTVGSLYADNIHPNVTGNDHLGAMFARWFNNSAYTNKWARSVISCHFDEISSAYKSRIQTFMATWEAQYLGFDLAYITKTSSKINAAFDWAFLCGPESDGGFTQVSDSHIALNGTNQLFNFGYNISLSPINVSQNDWFQMHKIKSNLTAEGTNAFAWGITNGTTRSEYIRQTTTPSFIWGNGALSGDTYGTKTLFEAKDYTVVRSGASAAALYEDGVSVDTVTSTSVNFTNHALYAGALNNNGSPTAYWAGQVERMIRGKQSLISNWATFYAALNTLQGL